jgi:hypothetical protein
VGCLRSLLTGIGCLVVLVAAAVVGFLYRDRLASMYRGMRGVPEPPPAVYVTPSPAGAAQAEAALERLVRQGGPAYVDVTAAELAALIDAQLRRQPRRVLDSVAVSLGEERIRVRASLDMSVLPQRLMGPLASGLDRREPVVAGGTLSVAPDGRVLWVIDEFRIRDFPFPRKVISAIIASFDVPGAHDAAVPIPLPAGIGDVRVHPSGVRVYRASAR